MVQMMQCISKANELFLTKISLAVDKTGLVKVKMMIFQFSPGPLSLNPDCTKKFINLVFATSLVAFSGI